MTALMIAGRNHACVPGHSSLSLSDLPSPIPPVPTGGYYAYYLLTAVELFYWCYQIVVMFFGDI